MKRTEGIILLPKLTAIAEGMGENIKLARLRRRLSAEQVAERAQISRSTLWAVEKGTPTVAMGIYLKVLSVLGLEKDLGKVAEDDVFGRKLLDANMLIKKRSPRKK
jgi:transcriptional regulator with XRE-family HTH domain